MKITRIELCHPVNRPGKNDDNYRALPPPNAADDDWELGLGSRLAGLSPAHGVTARYHGGRDTTEMFIPSSNIKSIEYTEETKKK